MTPGSSISSQAEIRMTAKNKTVIWEKMVVIFKVAQLYITVILFSAWDKSHDPGANWSKLEHM